MRCCSCCGWELTAFPTVGRLPAAGGPPLLLALLVAVFPANLHMALHAEEYPDMPAIALWVRLPLQGLLMWWVWSVTRNGSKAK